MYSEKEIKKIIESLISNTKHCDIDWHLGKSIFNSDTSFDMVYKADDSTKFSMEVKLNTNFKIKGGYETPYLWIYNDAIIDDRLQVSGHEYKMLEDLRKEIYNKNIYPLVKNNNPDKKILSSIFDKINNNKRINRSKRLDEILDGEKSIFDRLFGK